MPKAEFASLQTAEKADMLSALSVTLRGQICSTLDSPPHSIPFCEKRAHLLTRKNTDAL